MGADYIPRSNERFRSWAHAFVGNLRKDPARFATTRPQVNFLQGLLDDFDQALAVSSAENTRTRPAILRKSMARDTLEWLCRRYARQIKENLGIPDAEKIALGIRPINVARRPVTCPETNPLLSYIHSTNTAHVLCYKDPVTNRKARPYGAAAVQLFMAIAPQKHASRSEARFVRTFTRNPIVVKFEETQDGLAATYWARWASERGETGPFSLPISVRIAA